MTVDLIIHGVPNGQDSWGKDDDRHYLSTFYTSKDDKEYLSVELRKVSGKPYAYYHYLKYNNVVAADGRPGSYLGITLRIDAYYKDTFNIYNILEIIYNRYLADLAFTLERGDGIRYKIPRFELIDGELKDIQSKVINLIALSAKPKDFENINDSFFNNDNKTLKAFLLDCTQDNVLQAVKKYGRVEVSKFYPSMTEMQKVKTVESKYGDVISQKDKDLKNANARINDLMTQQQHLQTNIANLNNEIESLKNDLKDKNIRLAGLQNTERKIQELEQKKSALEKESKGKDIEIVRLKNDINRYKDHRNIKELLEQIKDPLWKLAEIAGRQSVTFPDSYIDTDSQDISNSNHSNKKRKQEIGKNTGKRKKSSKKWNPMILIAISTILLLGLLGASYFIYNNARNDKEPLKATSSIELIEYEDNNANKEDLYSERIDSTKQDSITNDTNKIKK